MRFDDGFSLNLTTNFHEILRLIFMKFDDGFS